MSTDGSRTAGITDDAADPSDGAKPIVFLSA